MKETRKRKLKMRFLALFCTCLLFCADLSAYAADATDDPLYGRAAAQTNGAVSDTSDLEIDAVGASGLVVNGNYIHDSRFANYTVRNVIDVSVYQGKISWEKVKAAGIDYAFIRLGFHGYSANGRMMVDANYRTNITNAIAAGVKVGVYFFSQAITKAEARAEADFVLENIRGYEISLPVVMDFEYVSESDGRNKGRLYDANLSKNAATNVCKAFCARVKSAGYTPMLYANKDMLQNGLNASKISSNYKIWLARYSSAAGYSGAYQFWQYSDKGRVDGINGYVDCNFYYDDSSLQAPGKTKITSIESFSKRKVTINWKNVSPVSGYEISYSTNKNYKNAKKVTVTSGTKTTIKKLTSGKKYYFRIRVYNEKANGQKLYSGYAKKTVTVK